MATAHLTIIHDDVDGSLSNALWFIRNGRWLLALYALENAAARCVDDRKEQISALATTLGNTPVVRLASA